MGGNRQGRNFTVYTKFPEGKREFYQHDDRGYSEQSFRSSGNETGQGSRQYYPRGGRGQNYGNQGVYYGRGNRRNSGNYRGRGGSGGRGQRRFFQDDDQQMDEKRSKLQQIYDSSRGSRRGRDNRRGGGSSRPSINKPTSGWHKITIRDCESISNEEVLRAISEYVSEPIVPVMMETRNNNCSFYIEDNVGLARAIANLSGRLDLRDNRKHSIACIDYSPPHKNITTPQMEIVKTVMSDRYSSELKRIDLTNFHNDKQLLQNQIFYPLYRPALLSTVMEVLAQNCSEVEEIDLSGNQLSNAHGIADLMSFNSIQRLFLQKNKIRSIDSLQKLKGLPIQELSLEGNTLCGRFKDAESYTSAVRNIFPKVVRLDGMELPKPIGFEVEEDNAKLPAILPSFFSSESVGGVMVKFIEHYFQAFESDNRKALEPAYTEDALMSISTFFPDYGIGSKNTHSFDKENRNFRRVVNTDKRYNLVSKGRTAISQLLCRLPKCLHDPNSFVIDIPFAKPALTHVVLTGVFRQVVDDSTQPSPPLRNFMKSMVIIPVGSGFCISNEELFINIASVEQIRNAFKTPSSPQVPSTSVPTSPAQSSQMTNLEPAKIELVKKFAAESKMLPEFCIMCLENNNWDFLKAGEMFVNLQKENKIPPEYFGLPS